MTTVVSLQGGQESSCHPFTSACQPRAGFMTPLPALFLSQPAFQLVFASILNTFGLWQNSYQGSGKQLSSLILHRGRLRPLLGLLLFLGPRTPACPLAAPTSVPQESDFPTFSVLPTSLTSCHFSFSVNDFALTISPGPGKNQMSHPNRILKMSLMKEPFRKVEAKFLETSMT